MNRSQIPVMVGISQIEQRLEDLAQCMEPLDLMEEAVKRAAEDTGRTEILSQAESVYVIRGVWNYQDPARAIAEQIGAERAISVGTEYGGNMVQRCINDACLAIDRGELSVAILAGAEVGRSLALARRSGTEMKMRPAGGTPDRLLGESQAMLHPTEKKHRIQLPVWWYAMFESAIRHQRGESLEENRERISELWARFNAVAVGNPHAWIREEISAEAIRTPSHSNRMISFPYPLLMNANSRVDQAAAIILCSLERAEQLGIPADKWIFPHSGCEGYDPSFMSIRQDFHSSPAIRIAGNRALELAEVDSGDLDHVDLYSCFPSAVQVAANELGLSQERTLTVTGGLTFGGGPLNDYVMHSVTRMAEVLREDPGAVGLITANGGALTKHAFGVYSTALPEAGYRFAEVQPEIDAFAQREIVDDYDGPVTIEAYTVVYDEEGPARALAACLLESGERAWATREDRSLARSMTEEEFCGRTARRRADGQLTLS